MAIISGTTQVAQHIRELLYCLGYDITDQHFLRTPERAAEVLLGFAKNGDPEDVKRLLEVKFLEERTIDSVVIEGPISYDSMCAHHMLPVTGIAYVGYLPNRHVCGLSKLARVTYHFAKQFTVQERVTQDIADALEQHLTPLGTMVVIEALHGCLSMRGVKERDTKTVTSAVRGVFKESPASRAEFLSLIGRRT